MEFITLILPLVGVLLGGLITFFIQQSVTHKQQNWEREKIEMDYLNKKETDKFEVFNNILHMNAKYPVLEYYTYRGPELNEKEYFERIRPLLYEIYHLLDEVIVYEVENIEGIFERQYAEEEGRDGDVDSIALSYMKIMKLIKQDFKNLRESKVNMIEPKMPKKKWNNWLVYSEEEIKEIDEHRQKNLNE